jgi:hypothetical protein
MLQLGEDVELPQDVDVELPPFSIAEAPWDSVQAATSAKSAAALRIRRTIAASRSSAMRGS